jgi:hypothetical protein
LRFTAYGFVLFIVVMLESRVVRCVHCDEDVAEGVTIFPHYLIFLGAFTELLTASISFIMYACPFINLHEKTKLPQDGFS